MVRTCSPCRLYTDTGGSGSVCTKYNHGSETLTYSVESVDCISAEDIELELKEDGSTLRVVFCGEQTVVLIFPRPTMEADLRCRFVRDT